MRTLEIIAEPRKQTGKSESKKLRNKGNVPCVMYGGKENIHFYSHENNFNELVYTPNVYIVSINVDGKKYKGVLKDIQFHPVTDKISHIDFVEVFDDKPVTIIVPVNLTGESVGIKGGGKLRLKRRHLTIRGYINDLPDKLDIDISKLDIGQTIQIKELVYDGIEILDPPRAMVVAVISSRLALKGMEIIEEVEEEAVEGEEEAEGEETKEGAEGTEGKAEEKAEGESN
ncbi:MAG: 50S ribosomal protein L25/general stress protein Ctc [Bacteroidales bacterium]|nr:50S ribosomal protein L25/general stress protein Ctc [Bacteroidales bacterium]